jgi:hypothetical protein
MNVFYLSLTITHFNYSKLDSIIIFNTIAFALSRSLSKPVSNANADFDPPPGGWGTKLEDLEYKDDWNVDDSKLCAELNFGKGPIVFKYIGLAYMFEGGRNFYFWYCIDLAGSGINSSTNLDEIINIMKERGEKNMKTKNILRQINLVLTHQLCSLTVGTHGVLHLCWLWPRYSI